MKTILVLIAVLAAPVFPQNRVDQGQPGRSVERGATPGYDAAIGGLEKQLELARQQYGAQSGNVKVVEWMLDRVRTLKMRFDPSVLSKIAELPDFWWNDPGTMSSLGLTGNQQKGLRDVWVQYRGRLLDGNNALERAEGDLNVLVRTGSRDDKKIADAIDNVAVNRAELEKVHGRMLLEMRNLLTPDQWAKLDKSQR